MKGGSRLFCGRSGGCVKDRDCEWVDGADELCHCTLGIGYWCSFDVGKRVILLVCEILLTWNRFWIVRVRVV